jgi:hypothetical protein
MPWQGVCFCHFTRHQAFRFLDLDGGWSKLATTEFPIWPHDGGWSKLTTTAFPIGIQVGIPMVVGANSQPPHLLITCNKSPFKPSIPSK